MAVGTNVTQIIIANPTNGDKNLCTDVTKGTVQVDFASLDNGVYTLYAAVLPTNASNKTLTASMNSGTVSISIGTKTETVTVGKSTYEAYPVTLTPGGPSSGTLTLTAADGSKVTATVDVTFTAAPEPATVHYSTRYGTAPEAVSKERNGSGQYSMTQAELPTLSFIGAAFGGWYSDTACTQLVTAETILNGDVTLYAKWTLDDETVRTADFARTAQALADIAAEKAAAAKAASRPVTWTPSAADVGAAPASDLTSHTADTSNPHGVTAEQVGAVPASQKGAAGGVASLGSDGKVPSSQLPSGSGSGGADLSDYATKSYVAVAEDRLQNQIDGLSDDINSAQDDINAINDVLDILDETYVDWETYNTKIEEVEGRLDAVEQAVSDLDGSVERLLLRSSTPGSTKVFQITVDDSGAISATEVV